MSEDCLYLSVWAPAATATEPGTSKGLAVIVWLTGGQGVEEGDGAELAATGGIVVVKVESRRGALGFLATRHRAARGLTKPR